MTERCAKTKPPCVYCGQPRTGHAGDELWCVSPRVTRFQPAEPAAEQGKDRCTRSGCWVRELKEEPESGPCLLDKEGYRSESGEGEPCPQFIVTAQPAEPPAEPLMPEAIHDFEMAAMCYGKIDECATCGQPEAADIHNLALKDELEWSAREDAARPSAEACEHPTFAADISLVCGECGTPMVVLRADVVEAVRNEIESSARGFQHYTDWFTKHSYAGEEYGWYAQQCSHRVGKLTALLTQLPKEEKDDG